MIDCRLKDVLMARTSIQRVFNSAMPMEAALLLEGVGDYLETCLKEYNASLVAKHRELGIAKMKNESPEHLKALAVMEKTKQEKMDEPVKYNHEAIPAQRLVELGVSMSVHDLAALRALGVIA